MKEVQKEKDRIPGCKEHRGEHQRVWYRFCLKAGNIYSRETSKMACIAMVAKGLVVFTTNGTKVTVHEGEMLLFPPQHAFQSDVQENADILACRFEIDMLSELNCPAIKMAISKTGKEPQFSILKMNSAILDYQNQLKTYLDSDLIFTPLLELKMHELFFLLAFYYNKEDLSSFLAPIIDNVTPFRDFVTKNWQKARNVEELAEMANMSTSGFIKKFKKHFDESPYQWMLNRKARYILIDIKAGLIPLKVIADNYHFASYSHFSTFCKEQYGVSPVALYKMENSQ